MELTERIKSLASEKNATIGFKWQDPNGNWFAESDGYTVAELNEIIEDAEKWRGCISIDCDTA